LLAARRASLKAAFAFGAVLLFGVLVVFAVDLTRTS
jgi:hypothetical protein